MAEENNETAKEPSKDTHTSGLGALGFTHEEILMILGPEPKDDRDRIERGRLLGEVDFRKAVFDMAKNGSAAAMREYMGFVRNTRKLLRVIDLPFDYKEFSYPEMNLLDGLLRFRGNVTKACKYAGVPVRTYYYWMSRDTEHYQQFQEAVMVAKHMLDDAVEEVLMDKILVEGDSNLLQFYARTRLRNRGYTEKAVITDTEDELVILPDGTVSEEGRRLVADIQNSKKMGKAVVAALKLLDGVAFEDDANGSSDIIEGELVPKKD
jgi:hypothetical protein